MSDYLAVGGVTSVLIWLLTNHLTSAGPGVILQTSAVTALSPQMITAGATEDPQLNLFMYYVGLNPYLRNLDMPAYNGAGAQIANAPLTLDLHYLISAYGGAQFAAEILLGWAMKVLHDNPVVAPATIQDALAALASGSPTEEATLVATSTLAGQVDHIRITPETLTTEQIFQLWPAFQAPYRPSTAFRVSAVVIADTAELASGPPVRHRRLVALPMQSPVISGISPAMAAAGTVLTISGANFLGQAAADTVVSFDGAAPVAASLVQGGLVKVTPPALLAAGTRMVRVQRRVTFPHETTSRPGFTSSPALFQLVPTITDPSPVQATRGATLTLTVSPPVGRTQQVTVYLGDHAVPVPARLPGAPATATTVTCTVPADIPPTGTGTGAGIPIRVEVDSASSLVEQQANGQWTPLVQVT
jgi:hypothetical protein